MMDETREEYLWDRSGPADPEVERLERLLSRHRFEGGEPPRLETPARRARWLRPLLAVAAVAICLLGLRAYFEGSTFRSADSYRVEGVAGLERIRAGEGFETGGDDATVHVASIGDVRVAPGSRVRVERIESGAHYLFLERGQVTARILAAPQVFRIGTPAGWSIDLGCEYDLAVDDDGAARLTVRTGRVAFEAEGREVVVPMGSWCETAPGRPPSVPVSIEAPLDLVRAVRALERERDPAPEALQRVREADIRDHGATLWHLFLYAEARSAREVAYANLARVYPLPRGHDESAIRAGDPQALRAWREIVARDWPGTLLGKLGEKLDF